MAKSLSGRNVHEYPKYPARFTKLNLGCATQLEIEEDLSRGVAFEPF